MAEPATVFGWVVWLHLAATLFMVGVIWLVQLVHYPLMSRVGDERFREYHAQHTRRIAWVVVPAMLCELATAVVLVLPGFSTVQAPLGLAGLSLLVVIWLSTFAVQVPLHRRLADGFDAAAHRRLVGSNWLRTVAWTVRGFVAVAIAVTAARGIP